MTSASRFAVLLCTHNGELNLREQLESIAGQSQPPAALFVHDWASTDRSRQIVRAFIEESSAPMRTCLVEHDTAPGARASFLQAAVQSVQADTAFDYLLFCDQDDVWLPEKIAIYDQCASGQRPAILFSDAQLIDSAGRQIAPSLYEGYTPFVPPLDLRDASILLTNPVVGMTMCVRRDFLAQVSDRLQGSWMMHDWAVLLLALAHGERVQFVPRQLVRYRQHASNVMGVPTRSRVRSRVSKARRHFNAIRAQVALLADLPRDAWPRGAQGIFESGWRQRWAAARAAMRSRLLRERERMLLAAAIIVFW